MSAAAYRNGLMNIARCEADGEDVQDMIQDLADAVDLDPSLIRSEVDDIMSS